MLFNFETLELEIRIHETGVVDWGVVTKYSLRRPSVCNDAKIHSFSRNLLFAQRRRLTINVILTNGENIILKVLPTEKPSDIKRYIALEKGTDIADQKLMFRELELTDNKSLMEANITNGAIIRMAQEPQRGNTQTLTRILPCFPFFYFTQSLENE